MGNIINFSSSVNSIFDDFLNNQLVNFIGSDTASNVPSANVSVSQDDFKIELTAPGLQKENFNINVDKKSLTISTKKEKSNELNGDKFISKEFNYTSFSKKFQLPKGVEREAIVAKYECGILEIIIPKKEEAKELPPRTIQVN